MIVVLEILNILAGNAVLYKVVVPLDGELSELRLCFGTLEIENVGHFLFLGIGLEDAPFFLFAEQSSVLLVEPPFVVVEHPQIFDHLGLLVVVAENDSQPQTLSRIKAAVFVVLEVAVKTVYFDTNEEGELLEIELPCIILA